MLSEHHPWMIKRNAGICPFGVYHPKKPTQIRGVFDSSAQFKGVSLNKVLMSGTDLTNNLLGILMKVMMFQKDSIAVTGDIEKMFYQFEVDKDHRNFLRFFWYDDNDPTKQLIEYRMCVHVFGNTPSPAVATYGLRKSVMNSEPSITDFVCKNFYVDDGLISVASDNEAINLMKKTQVSLLENGKLRLHKIASNSKHVLNAFPSNDLAEDLKDVNLTKDCLPQQRSFGLIWDINMDVFTFRNSLEPLKNAIFTQTLQTKQ